MNYQDWLNAIDKLLQDSGAKFACTQIEEELLRTAHQQGVSPDDFVGRGKYLTQEGSLVGPLVPISMAQAKFLVRILGLVGVILILLGLVYFVFGAYKLIVSYDDITTFASGANDGYAETYRKDVLWFTYSLFVDDMLKAVGAAGLGLISKATAGILRATYQVPRT